MTEITFKDVRPFVRYARKLDSDMKRFPFSLCAYDCRLFYCKGGKGSITADGISYEVSAGTLIYIAAGLPYCYNPNPDDPMRILAFNFDLVWDNADISVPFPPDRAEDFRREKIVSEVLVQDIPAFSGVIVLEKRQYLYDKLSEINEEFTSSKVWFEQRCSGLMLSVLAEIVSGAENDLGGKGLSVVDSVIKFVTENYSQEITNGSLGELFGYHPNYLNQLFIQHTGKSLHRYLQDLRIMKAIHMLQDTDMQVSEVANLVGFKDLPHFSRYFKQKTGYSPSDFKQVR